MKEMVKLSERLAHFFLHFITRLKDLLSLISLDIMSQKKSHWQKKKVTKKK